MLQHNIEALFKQYYSKLCNTANRIVNDKDVAEDLVQDLFLKLWDRSSDFVIESTMEGYLMRAVTNAALNHIQKHKKNILVDINSSLIHTASYTKTDEKINQKELTKIVYNALDKLPPKCKTIFVLSRFEDMKYREIAEHLGISVKTVEYHMSTAIDKLQQELSKSLKYDYLASLLILCVLGI